MIEFNVTERIKLIIVNSENCKINIKTKRHAKSCEMGKDIDILKLKEFH